MINKVGIIGAGAVGGLYARLIADSIGKDNVYIIADEKRTKRYIENGIKINGEIYDFNYVADTTKGINLDLIIFATKFTQLRTAVNSAVNFVGENTILISAINGIISEDVLAEKFGYDNIVYAVAMGMDSTKFGNEINYTQTGVLAIGDRYDNKNSENLKAVTEFFERTDFPFDLPESIQKRMWGKFMMNVGLNQVCAVYDLPYGGVQCDGEAREKMIAAMKEVQILSKYEGVNLTDEDFKYWLDFNDSLTPDSMPSMRQDVISKRKTEVELFSGAVIEMGKKHNIPTPVNDELFKKIIEIENGFKES
jgi:2-dehydropantoate 2-reductase